MKRCWPFQTSNRNLYNIRPEYRADNNHQTDDALSRRPGAQDRKNYSNRESGRPVNSLGLTKWTPEVLLILSLSYLTICHRFQTVLWREAVLGEYYWW